MSETAATIRIDINSAGAEAGARRVNSALTDIERRARQTGAANDNLGSATDRLGRSMGDAAGRGGALGRIFDDIRGRAAGAAPAVAGLVGNLTSMGPVAAIVGAVAITLAAVGAAAIRAAAQTQQWKANLETMTGSAAKAQASYAALVLFAAQTPFDLGQSIDAFAKLRSLGLAATESRLTSFGNTAAAMGKDMNQMIEAVADASTGEFERLKEFGIKSKTEGDKVKFTFQGVTTSVGKNSTEIVKYLEDIGNTKFAGAMARQMDTLNGAFSGVSDNMQQMLSAIGEGALGAAVKDIVKSIASGIAYFTPFMASIGNLFGGIIQGVGGVLNGLGQLWAGFGQADAAGGLLTGLTVTFNLLGQGAQVFGNVVGAVFGAVGSMVGKVGGFMRSLFGDLLADLGLGFSEGGRSWANSIVGVLRAAKYVASMLPQLFAAAISDVASMFRGLGRSIAQLWNARSLGDLSKALDTAKGAVANSGGNTRRVVGQVTAGASRIYRDEKGAGAAIDRLLGRGGAAKLDTGLDAKAAPDAADGKKDKGASEAERRAKAMAEFWKKLEDERESARLFGLELEKHTKELELHKILGRDLVDGEKARIAALVEGIATQKAVTDLKKSTFELDNQSTLLAQRALGLTVEQAAVQDALDQKRLAALNAGVNIGTAEYQQELASYKLALERNQALTRRNELLKQAQDFAKRMSATYSAQSELGDLTRDRDNFLAQFASGALRDGEGNPLSEGVRDSVLRGFGKAARLIQDKPFEVAVNFARDALGTHGSTAERRGEAQREHDKLIQSLRDAQGAGRIGAAEFRAGVARAGDELRDEFAEIGTDFSRKMSAVAGLLGRLSSMIGGKLGKVLGSAGDAADGIGSFEQDKEDVSRGIRDAFGKNSAAVKGIGDAVGESVAGAGIGEQVGQLTKALGIKTSRTGSQVGGAIGGMVSGPLGAAVGGFLGGVVGGLFKKTKSGGATITGGGAGDLALSGDSGTYKKVAEGLGGEVQKSLQDIARQLGGSVGAFSGVTIGKRGDDYRVNVGGTSLKKKRGAKDFDDDAQAAVEFAVKTAISRGALVGLSDFARKAVGALEVEGAIALVTRFREAMADLDAINDPITAAVKSVTTSLDDLRKSMVEVGASTADLTRLDDYRAKKLDAVLRDQTSGFRDILDQLNGKVGGATALTMLMGQLAELERFKADGAAGRVVDQEAYGSLVGKLTGNLAEVYGVNTSAYQDVIGGLRDTTTSLLANATSAFNAAAGGGTSTTDGTPNAINAQTDQITATIGVSNDLLAQIAAAVRNVSFGGGGGGAPPGGINGRLVVAY